MGALSGVDLVSRGQGTSAVGMLQPEKGERLWTNRIGQTRRGFALAIASHGFQPSPCGAPSRSITGLGLRRAAISRRKVGPGLRSRAYSAAIPFAGVRLQVEPVGCTTDIRIEMFTTAGPATLVAQGVSSVALRLASVPLGRRAICSAPTFPAREPGSSSSARKTRGKPFVRSAPAVRQRSLYACESAGSSLATMTAFTSPSTIAKAVGHARRLRLWLTRALYD